MFLLSVFTVGVLPVGVFTVGVYCRCLLSVSLLSVFTVGVLTVGVYCRLNVVKGTPHFLSAAPAARHGWVRNHLFVSLVFRSDPEGVAMGSRRLLGVSQTFLMLKNNTFWTPQIEILASIFHDISKPTKFHILQQASHGSSVFTSPDTHFCIKFP